MCFTMHHQSQSLKPSMHVIIFEWWQVMFALGTADQSAKTILLSERVKKQAMVAVTGCM